MVYKIGLFLICVLGILGFIAIIPVGVYGKYDENGVELNLTIWRMRWKVFPLKEREDKKKKKVSSKGKTSPKKPSNKKGATKGSSPKKKKKNPKPKVKIGKKKSPSLVEIALLAKMIIPVVIEGFQRLGKYKKIHQLELKLVVGSSDPVEATMLYGKAHGIMGSIWVPLDNALNIQKGRGAVRLSFEEMTPQFSGIIEVSMTIGKMIALVFFFLREGHKIGKGIK